MSRDETRAKDTEGRVHYVHDMFRAFVCQVNMAYPAFIIGVQTHEPTTCLLCIGKQPRK